jgi:preprotein translocase SecE subunit
MSNESDELKTDVRPDKPKAPSTIATPKMKRGLKGFIHETKREMKKVNWPSRKETNRLTFVVLSLVVLIAVMLSVMGWASDTLVTIITKGRV